MEKISIAIIGGGAAGLFLATALRGADNIVIFERNDRVGRKLSATGNGQGNVTNLVATSAEYFSSEKEGRAIAEKIIRTHSDKELTKFFERLGVLLSADERGRVYPASRQASALTDALRFTPEVSGKTLLSTRVLDLEKTDDGFILHAEMGEEKRAVRYFAERVVLCTGGKAAKNFGTDGTAYALAEKFGHTVTNLYPSLVQLKTDTVHTKTLKGIRVSDGILKARTGGKERSLRGDIIFTDYGVSGDAVFRLSAFIADGIADGKTELSIDFLPDMDRERILAALLQKRAAFSELPDNELLFGIVNNQVGRAIMKRAEGNPMRAAELVKAFPLKVTGSLGFDYAQVTKGGIPLSEMDENLQSRFVKGLYFAGEILDVDGQCGGFNLQWAYASARTVAEAIVCEKARR